MSDYEQIRYCVQCGTKLERRLLFGEDRPICPSCGWIFFADPKVAAGVVIEKIDAQTQTSQVLLVRRTNEPCRGLWSFPAGFVNAREDPARAAERECLEETGLRVKVTGLLHLISGREHPRGADILLVYSAVIVSGELRPGDDADLAQFFPRDDLPPLAFRATRLALEK